MSEVKTEEFRLPRRTKRLSNTHTSKSETDLVKMANGTREEEVEKRPPPPPRKFLRLRLVIAIHFSMFSAETKFLH